MSKALEDLLILVLSLLFLISLLTNAKILIEKLVCLGLKVLKISHCLRYANTNKTMLVEVINLDDEIIFKPKTCSGG